MKKKKELFIDEVLKAGDKKLHLNLYHLSKMVIATKEKMKYADANTFSGKLALHEFHKPMSKLLH